MNSKHIRADYNVAWPGAELAVMGPEGAVNILYRQALEQSADPETERARLVADYNETYANPFIAAGLGYLDDVIEPADTRACLITALGNLAGKKQSLPPKKHGNIPL
jgi:propionyl-CoA carboxylase beta chain